MAGYAEAGQQQRFRGRLSDRSSSARRARAPTSAREVLRPATIEVVGLMSLGRLWLNAGLTVRSQRCFDFELAADGNLHRLVERGLDFFSTRTRDGVQNGLDRCSVESARHRAAGSRDGRKVRILPGMNEHKNLLANFGPVPVPQTVAHCGPQVHMLPCIIYQAGLPLLTRMRALRGARATAISAPSAARGGDSDAELAAPFALGRETWTRCVARFAKWTSGPSFALALQSASCPEPIPVQLPTLRACDCLRRLPTLLRGPLPRLAMSRVLRLR